MPDSIDVSSKKQLDREFVANQSFAPTVTVDRSVVPTAIQHGMELWWDGSTPTKRLDQRDDSSQFSRFVNARVEGKVAEVAFAVFCETYFGISSMVDWRIYGDYDETDDGDLQYLVGEDDKTYPPAVPIDIKKTKPWNQWLAIRESIYRKFSDQTPIVLTKLRIESELDLDRFEDTDSFTEVESESVFCDQVVEFAVTEFPLNVEIVGTVYPDELTDHFASGEKLYDPDTGSTLGDPLRCENRGIHVDNLRDHPTRWNRAIDDIVGEHPVDWKPLTVTGIPDEDTTCLSDPKTNG